MDTADVRDAAATAVQQSKTFIGRQVDQRTTELGDQIAALADDLRSVGEHLRGNAGLAPAAGFVDQGVGVVDRVAAYLRDADSERLVRDLEQVAREQPWAVASAAMVAGFAGARFLKSSSARRYADTYGGSGYAS